MFKKITATSLAFILATSMTVAPTFAAENQNGSFIAGQNKTTINKSATTIKYDKKDNKNKNKGNYNFDKDDMDDLEDILKYFMDSDDYSWASKSIERLGALGIFSGNGKGYFNPKNNVTHAEAIAMVLKLTGNQKQAEAITTQPEYFRDLCDPWSYGYLKLALDKGIIIPEEDGRFNPRTPAKRVDIAKYVVRALGMRDEALQNMNATLNFRDASSIPANARGYVYVINDLKIMQGSNNQFQPNKPITRAEMAVILDKAEGRTEDPTRPSTTVQGSFVAFDSVNYKLTLKVNNRDVVYNILPNVPVYKDSTYTSISTLKVGDVVKVIVDSQKRIIFIEFVKDASTNPSTGKIYTQTESYENLPQVLRDKVDTLKFTQSFTAFKHNQSIYLIATRGQMPTGGYTIDIQDVYKETVETGKYNLKAIVEMTNPTNSFTTQVISYPYEIVKLNYFDGIDKINFVNSSNGLLAQTVINTLDATEVISGKIDSVDVYNRIIRVLENDNVIRTYLIPANVTITLNNQTTTLASLTRNMSIAITRTNGVITGIAAQQDAQIIETINGKIDSVDATNRIIRVLENDNVVRTYLIPANVEITLNNQAVSLSALIKDMPIVITKTNGIITKLAATNIALETISGKIDSIDTTNRILKVLESDNNVRTYYIPTYVSVTLNNRSASLSSLVKDMPVVLTRTNGVITTIAATTVTETINGKINAVDISNRTISVLENDNIVRSYNIPTNIEITLNNRDASLSSLIKDMPVVLTKTNGVIRKIAATNIVETINGKINAIDITNRIVSILESDNIVRTYLIPANVQITLNNQRADLLALAKDMPVVLTRTNSVITKLAATNVIETIYGKIDSVDTTNNVVRLLESNNVVRAYNIPATAQITLGNQPATLSSLANGMIAVLTGTNGTITKLAVERDIRTIEGILITTTMNQDKTFISVKVGNVINAYEITSNTAVFYNNQATTIQNIPFNSSVVIKIENGVLIEVRNN